MVNEDVCYLEFVSSSTSVVARKDYWHELHEEDARLFPKSKHFFVGP